MKSHIKMLFWAVVDVFLINIAIIAAYMLRFDGNIDASSFKFYRESIIAVTVLKITVFYFFNLYKSLWRYAGINELISVVVATGLANAAVMSYVFISGGFTPRSIYLIAWALDIILIGGSRFSYRVFKRVKHGERIKSNERKRIMIVGAGSAGAVIIKEMKQNPELSSIPVALIDDNTSKHGRRISGVPVMGDRYSIVEVAEKKYVDEIIIAIPSTNKKEISEIIEECKKTNCKLKILPGVNELIDGKVSIQKIRDVELEDLLGREPIKVNLEEISGYLTDKVVLVTGGGGSIGSELCRQIAGFNPSKLIIFDVYENGAYDIQNELLESYSELDMTVLIGSIRDKARLNEVVEQYRPNIVFHAAAHKHVPLMERNPYEAIKNNVFGTLNVAEAADKYKSERFVLISTDKAVNPTNIMGATKRLAEMIIQSMNKISDTEFVAVRFGNVLGSNGSVIPLFKKQIKKGGPVKVTHPDITRYFMTIPEAVQLVIQAGAMAEGGEIFILDMGKPVKILDLAKDLIRLSGFEPEVDIQIEITGLRPGEKLYEELLMDEEGISKTKHRKIFVGKPSEIDFKSLKGELKKLEKTAEKGISSSVELLRKLVPTYNTNNSKVLMSK